MPQDSDSKLKRAELWLFFITNFLLTGVLGGIVYVTFSYWSVKQKQDEILLQQQTILLGHGDLELRVVAEPLQRIVSDPCGRDAVNASTYLDIILNAGLVRDDQAKKYREAANKLVETCPQVAPTPPNASTGTCVQIESLAKLGWTSGHKTKYCLSKGFDGVWNRPFSSYDSGGFCYKGDGATCRAKIEAMR
jgi:hypothetical protein